MTKLSPVWKREASAARYTAIPAKSSGSPQRRIGTRPIAFSLNLSHDTRVAVMSVRIQPGRIALARTP